MYGYIARQPIFSADKTVYGYELLFRDGELNSFPNIDADEATSKLLLQHHLLLGVERITGNKPAFINFSADTLLHRFPTSINPASTVIEILETVPATAELLAVCQSLHSQGYKLALDDHDFDPKWDEFLPYITYVKVDVLQFNMLQISRYLRRIASYSLVLLAEKVETAEQFEKLKMLGFHLFQGYLFARPEMMKQKQLNSSKANLLLLIAEASKVELDFELLAGICQRDVGLSYKLMRFVNNSQFAARQPISSLKLAMVSMGEPELKKFIALLALANLADGVQDDRLTVALTRARFCDLLAVQKRLSNNPPSAFLTGLFSNVHEIIEQPQQLMLEQLPLQTEIKQALLTHTGLLGQILQLTLAFERGDWQLTINLEQQISGIAELAEVYQDAVRWADSILVS
ncbi:histidine kinase [Arsukibacterium sp. MJ3]|uniref:EAL and HDOD domain-containing protein n=1 Tax=Arsukibacterium sp. MJ3 TaxID=1632859 RepID=UPI00062724DA|nr:EAL domain-containing protein [Arsukibacterium sp. MJ3]KKO48337.1 histidine kinase [Arsukibacterium sp. MJ3]